MRQPCPWIFALIFALGACDGVGRALVDSQGGESLPSGSCGEVPLCESTLEELKVPTSAGEYPDFKRCSDSEPAVIVMHDLPLPSCQCQSYALDLKGAHGSPSDLSLDGTFRDCDVHISTEQPIEIEVQHGWLENVGFVLSGPVDLRVSDGQLERVRIRSETTVAGAPSVTLERSTLLVSALANDDGVPPLSMLRVSQTTVDNSWLAASSAEFASVTMQRVTFAAHDFQANDLSIDEGLLTLDRALIAGLTLNTVKVAACHHVRLVKGDLSGAEIAACVEQLQLYSMHVRDSALDGNIEMDMSDLSDSNLGRAETTSVVSYDTRFSSISLCDHVLALKIWGGYTSCVSCGAPLTEEEGLVCSAGATSSPDPRQNLCSAFEGVPVCDDFPARLRPI